MKNNHFEKSVKSYYNYIITKIIFFVFIIYIIGILIVNYQNFFGNTFYQVFSIYSGLMFFLIYNIFAYLFATHVIPTDKTKSKRQIHLAFGCFVLIFTHILSFTDLKFMRFVDKTYIDLDKAYQNYQEKIVYLNKPERLNLDNPKIRSYNAPMRTLDGKDTNVGYCEMYSFQSFEPCHFKGDYTTPYRAQYFSVRNSNGKLLGLWALKVESLDGKDVIFDGREIYKQDQIYNKRYLFIFLAPLYTISILLALLNFIPIPKHNH